MTEKINSLRLENLPTPVSTFIGRENEIPKVTKLILENRLVTLTGAGGSGKTRLALKVAHDLLGKFNYGIWFIELASLEDASLIPQEIASKLNIRERPGQLLTDSLSNHISSHSSLLILDNCEHLISACAEISDTLLQKCPNLRILITSREVLRITGEVVWTVPPLSLPSLQPLMKSASAPKKLMEYEKSESVQLFIARAIANSPEFEPTTNNAAWVAEICRRLDGMPLAIELAAAQIRSLSVQEIAQRLDNRFHLLTSGSRIAPPRQKTLASAIDWSYGMLPPMEQKVLRYLSVFAGGATLESAEAVCTEEMAETAGVFEVISHLVNKSLLMANSTEQKETRYHLLETIREYALEKLAESEEKEHAQNRHLEFVLQLVEEAEVKLRGPERENWYEKVEGEHGNMLAALGWALESQNADAGLRMASGLSFFWAVRGYLKEGIKGLDKALEQRESASATSIAKALRMLGFLLLTSEGRDLNQIIQLLEESLKLYQELQDNDGIATVLNYLGVSAGEQGEYLKSKEFYTESLALRREIGDPWGIAHTLQNYSQIFFQEHDYASAKKYTEETITFFNRAGDQHSVARTLGDLAEIARIEGDSAQAAILLTESLSQVLQFGDKWSAADVLKSLARLECEQGKFQRAALLLGAAETLRETINMLPLGGNMYDENHEKNLATVKKNLSEKVFTQAWVEGSSMSIEQLVAFVSNEPDSSSIDKILKEKFGGLTAREREAAVLISQGISNYEIAETMTIGIKTVETYVTRILKKLGFESRVQIATWAIENDLK